MKKIVVLIFMCCHSWANAQDTFMHLSFSQDSDTAYHEINLSDSLSENRIGVWEKGDYVVKIDLDFLYSYYQKENESLKQSIEKLTAHDSLNILTYQTAISRYTNAVEQLRTAESGFNLRNLVLYIGLNNEEENLGNSSIIESHIQQLVISGDAIVYFEKKRIFQLKSCTISDPIMSVATIYYDQLENYLFNYFGYINW